MLTDRRRLSSLGGIRREIGNRMLKGRVVTGVVSAATLLTVAMAAPASAQTSTVRDKKGDAPKGIDITKVDVSYTASRVQARVHLRDFPRGAMQGYKVWIDTDDTDKKPDFTMQWMSQEIYAGKTRGWDLVSTSRHPYGSIERAYFSRHRAENYFTLGIPAHAIGDPARVRVAVTSQKWGWGGRITGRDHLIARHAFTPWVAQH